MKFQIFMILSHFTETLRKYTPINELFRVAAKDYQIPNTNLVIEKDTMVLLPIYAIHHDPDIYENPERFDPERFTEERKLNRHPFAHIPFGDGPRNCIGWRFGLMQSKLGLIQILLSYKVSPSPRTTIPMILAPNSQVLSPLNDMWLYLTKI